MSGRRALAAIRPPRSRSPGSPLSPGTAWLPGRRDGHRRAARHAARAGRAASVGAYLAARRTGDRQADQPTVPDALTATLLRYATRILSGPGGLASNLRTALTGPQATGVSLPLDTGTPTPTIPPYLRRLLVERDRHCAFPGCQAPPRACHGHHLIPRAKGGTTRLTNLVLLCSFHHLTVIHRWGWTLALNADGTTTATSPGGYRVLHSRGSPRTSVA